MLGARVGWQTRRRLLRLCWHQLSSKNLVSSKWWINNCILARPNFMREEISRGCGDCEFFSTKFSKKKTSREINVVNNLFQFFKFFKEKTIVMNKNHGLKIMFHCCCERQKKTQKIKETQYSIGKKMLIIIKCHNLFNLSLRLLSTHRKNSSQRACEFLRVL